jgi:3-hydroxyacyl-CoA dehydrogenase
MRKIRRAAVIGAGVMGRGIAALLASAGIDIFLLDIVPPDPQGEEVRDEKERNRIVQAGLEAIATAKPPVLMHPRDIDRIRIGNLEDDFERLGACDWIIEAVLERPDIKRALFKRIDSVKKPGAIVSSNTSGIPLEALSKGLSREFRRHFLGTHFFNPVRHMHLLEVIPGKSTLAGVVRFISDFGERVLGKGIVQAKDTPNFVGNRIGVQGIARALHHLVTDGLSVPEADALLGPVLGRPKTASFRTIDMVGLDTLGYVMENTYRLLPQDEERAFFQLPEYAIRMIRDRLLGNKTGQGFYKKEKDAEGKKRILALNLDTFQYEPFARPAFPCLAEAEKATSLPGKIRAVVNGTDRGARFAWKVLSASLLYAASRVPHIADTIVEIDHAMRWGYNFTLGPFAVWDAIGVAESAARMEAEGRVLPEAVKAMLAAGHDRFYKMKDGARHYFDLATGTYKKIVPRKEALDLALLKEAGKAPLACPSASLVDLGDGVFCCEFHTKMNTLNEENIDFIHRALDYVDDNGLGLVIGNQAPGMPGAFCAGADLMALAMTALAGRVEQIGQLVRRLQSAVQRMRYISFPVVAAPYGLTLGGGCEVCLGADRMVAHAELYMGLVEVGVGLLPAGGGCLNLYKKMISALPEKVTGVDLTRFLVPAFMNIATATVSTSAADARANGFLGPEDRIVFNLDHLIGEAKKEVLRMAGDGYRPPPRNKIKVAGEAFQGMVDVQVADYLRAGHVSEYDAFLAKRIAHVMSGGDVRSDSEVDEQVILNLEAKTFLDLLKEKKTHQRIEHMLKTRKPLRN